jgi:hypothetical protein
MWVGSDQPFRPDPHPALYPGTGQGNPGRAALPRSFLQPIPGFYGNDRGGFGWDRSQPGTACAVE